MRSAGDGELVVPYKRTESNSCMYKNEHNEEIRKQLMVNEWGFGFTDNRYSLFLERWPFEK